MTSLHKPEQDDIKNVSPGKLQLNGYPTAREESTLFIYQVQWSFVDCIAIRSRKYIIFDIKCFINHPSSKAVDQQSLVPKGARNNQLH